MDSEKCIAICVTIFAVVLVLGISLWVKLATDASVERTHTRAAVCRTAPAPQIATCLKLNG